MNYSYKLIIIFGFILIAISILFISLIIKSDKIRQRSDLLYINFEINNNNTSYLLYNSLNTNKNTINNIEKNQTKQDSLNWHSGGIKISDNNKISKDNFKPEPEKIKNSCIDLVPYFEYDEFVPEDYHQIINDSFKESILNSDLNNVIQIEKPAKNISFKLFSNSNIIGSVSMDTQFEDFDKIDNFDISFDKCCCVALSRYICFNF